MTQRFSLKNANRLIDRVEDFCFYDNTHVYVKGLLRLLDGTTADNGSSIRWRASVNKTLTVKGLCIELQFHHKSDPYNPDIKFNTEILLSPHDIVKWMNANSDHPQSVKEFESPEYEAYPINLFLSILVENITASTYITDGISISWLKKYMRDAFSNHIFPFQSQEESRFDSCLFTLSSEFTTGFTTSDFSLMNSALLNLAQVAKTDPRTKHKDIVLSSMINNTTNKAEFTVCLSECSIIRITMDHKFNKEPTLLERIMVLQNAFSVRTRELIHQFKITDRAIKKILSRSLIPLRKDPISKIQQGE